MSRSPVCRSDAPADLEERWRTIEGKILAAADNRRFVNAVLYVARTGIPWRDLPERFGHWNSVWRRFDRWCAKGVWTEIATVLGEPDLEELHLDSGAEKGTFDESRILTRSAGAI